MVTRDKGAASKSTMGFRRQRSQADRGRREHRRRLDDDKRRPLMTTTSSTSSCIFLLFLLVTSISAQTCVRTWQITRSEDLLQTCTGPSTAINVVANNDNLINVYGGGGQLELLEGNDAVDRDAILDTFRDYRPDSILAVVVEDNKDGTVEIQAQNPGPNTGCRDNASGSSLVTVGQSFLETASSVFNAYANGGVVFIALMPGAGGTVNGRPRRRRLSRPFRTGITKEREFLGEESLLSLAAELREQEEKDMERAQSPSATEQFLAEEALLTRPAEQQQDKTKKFLEEESLLSSPTQAPQKRPHNDRARKFLEEEASLSSPTPAPQRRDAVVAVFADRHGVPTIATSSRRSRALQNCNVSPIGFETICWWLDLTNDAGRTNGIETCVQTYGCPENPCPPDSDATAEPTKADDKGRPTKAPNDKPSNDGGKCEEVGCCNGIVAGKCNCGLFVRGDPCYWRVAKKKCRRMMQKRPMMLSKKEKKKYDKLEKKEQAKFKQAVKKQYRAWCFEQVEDGRFPPIDGNNGTGTIPPCAQNPLGGGCPSDVPAIPPCAQNPLGGGCPSDEPSTMGP